MASYNDNDRLSDLWKQGFMRSAMNPKKKRVKKTPPPTVACDLCLNWHSKGKHTTPITARKERERDLRAQGKSEFQREIGTQTNRSR